MVEHQLILNEISLEWLTFGNKCLISIKSFCRILDTGKEINAWAYVQENYDVYASTTKCVCQALLFPTLHVCSSELRVNWTIPIIHKPQRTYNQC